MPTLQKVDESHCGRATSESPPSPEVGPRDSLGLSAERAEPRGIRRIVLLTLAGFFFGIAALGAILPGLPCTPFLLLTSYFLLRSWPQMNDRLLRSRWFGPMLRDWQDRGGMTRRLKVKAVLLVAVVVGVTLYFADWSLLWFGLVGALAVIGIVVIMRLPETRRN